MKKYLAPEFEKVEYPKVDVLLVSGQGIGKENDNLDDFLGG